MRCGIRVRRHYKLARMASSTTASFRRAAILAIACLSAASGALAQATPGSPTGATNAPFWTGMSDAASFEQRHGRPARTRADAPRRSCSPSQRARTIDNTLRPYDDVLLELDAVASQAQLVQSVHPDEAVRQAAERVSQKAERVRRPSCR